ncbi:MAG: helix-turn-helix domain-containing protein [Thermus caldifontis]
MSGNTLKHRPGENREEAVGETRDPLGGKLLLTVNEVARALGLSRRTVYRLVEEGKLKKVHPTPRSARITRESLEAFLRSLEAPEKAGEKGKGVVDRAREVLRRFGL